VIRKGSGKNPWQPIAGGAAVVFADGHCDFIAASIAAAVYSTIDGECFVRDCPSG